MKTPKTHNFLFAMLIAVYLISATQVGAAKLPLLGDPYLGQTPPGMVPRLFSPVELQADSAWFWHGSPMFSPDLTEMYFTKYVKAQPRNYTEIQFVKYESGQWTAPQKAPSANSNYSENNSFFSSSNDTLYFQSARPGGFIFRITRTGGDWSQPVPLPIPVPAGKNPGLQFSMTKSGAIYSELWENNDTDGNIYRWRLVNGRYAASEKLGGGINTPQFDFMPFIDPDERFLLFGSNRPGGFGETDLYLAFRQKDDTWSSPKNLGALFNTTSDDTWPCISPDGKYLFFCRSGEFGFDPYWIDAKILENYGPGGVIAFAITPPDGNAEIFLINADGSGKQQLTNQPGKLYGPAYSPDAKKIAFYNHFNDQTWSLFLMNADGSNIQQLSNKQNVLDWSPDWSPDGSQIAFARSYAAPTWRSEIWVMHSDGSNLRRLGSVDGQGPDWSPDSSKIVYFNYVDGGGDIWVMNADGSNPIKLTTNPSEDWWPRWSPDGSKIAFQSKRDGNHEIYVMHADGSNPERLTNNSTDDEDPNWSPDGTRLAFISMRDGHYEIYIMNADGSDQTRLTTTNGHAIDPDWKPIAVPTSVRESGKSFNSIPEEFQLFQNYPNPFNPTTTIRFLIPDWERVTLNIYDATGQNVAALLSQQLQAGEHAITWNAMNYPSGIYFYRIFAGNQISEAQKMCLIK